jgi:ATP-dependent DNA helicase RecQ
MHQTKDLLKSVFGFDAFRPGQEEVVSAILAGRDVLAIMPTGGGKSLCYQLPALRNEGLTVVISPLIALMRDQVAALREAGVEAGALNSANDPWETERVFEALEGDKLRLLYMAPERLSSEASIGLLRRSGVTLLAVDEAHCVSQWGHDFRPDYLRIGHLREALGGVQTAAFTATADAETRDDIQSRLFPAPPEVFPPRTGRDHLLRLAQEDRDLRHGTGIRRGHGAGLPRRAGPRDAQRQAGPVHPRGRGGDDGNGGFRHGRGQTGCALRHPC